MGPAFRWAMPAVGSPLITTLATQTVQPESRSGQSLDLNKRLKLESRGEPGNVRVWALAVGWARPATPHEHHTG
jgi:hypothetical protein